MPVSRVQTLRSSVKGQRPGSGSREVGELYVNYPDRALGVIDTSKAPLDLLAVRFFSVAADYAVDDYVLYSGTMFKALVPVTSGGFNGGQWDAVLTDSELTGGKILERLADVDGIASGLDADLLDGLDSLHFLARANHTGTLPSNALVPADLLAAIKTVDGAGSGLDADLIDGQGAGYFLERANHSGVQSIATITSLQPALDSKAPIASPDFTGNPLAPTPATADDSRALATTAYVKSNLVNYAPLISPNLLGAPQAPTQPPSSNNQTIATTAFVKSQGFATLASPAFTGNPTAPTPVSSDNDTTLATTAFVQQLVAAISGGIPPGSVIWTAAADAPAGYLKANGAAVSRVAFNNLFIAIGTTYGAGDGSTTFNLPDLRGEFVRSLDDGRGVDLGRSLGTLQDANVAEHTHAFTGTPMPNHNHTASSGTESADHSHLVSGNTGVAGTHTHTYPANNIVASAGPAPIATNATYGNDGTLTSSQATYTGTGASGTDHFHGVSIQSGGRSAAHTHVISVVAQSAGTPAGSNANYGSGTDTRPRNIALLACIKY
jgi:microcystin-dependent protein